MSSKAARGAGIGLAQIGELSFQDQLAKDRDATLARLKNDDDIQRMALEHGYHQQDLELQAQHQKELEEQHGETEQGLLETRLESEKPLREAEAGFYKERGKYFAGKAGGDTGSVVATTVKMTDAQGKPLIDPNSGQQRTTTAYFHRQVADKDYDMGGGNVVKKGEVVMSPVRMLPKPLPTGTPPTDDSGAPPESDPSDYTAPSP